MRQVARIRSIILVLVGISGLLIKRRFSGSLGEVAYCYLGNVSVSFSVYYLVSLAARGRFNKVAYVLIALVALESFELTDGFGIMSNVYDQNDLIANAIGVAIALVVDVVLDRTQARSSAVR